MFVKIKSVRWAGGRFPIIVSYDLDVDEPGQELQSAKWIIVELAGVRLASWSFESINKHVVNCCQLSINASLGEAELFRFAQATTDEVQNLEGIKSERQSRSEAE